MIKVNQFFFWCEKFCSTVNNKFKCERTSNIYRKRRTCIVKVLLITNSSAALEVCKNVRIADNILPLLWTQISYSLVGYNNKCFWLKQKVEGHIKEASHSILMYSMKDISAPRNIKNFYACRRRWAKTQYGACYCP